MIKSSGFRIGPTEIEDSLLSHYAVAEAAVIGKPDPDRGSIVKAFINVSFWTFISRLFGFLRDVLLAASIGAGPISDAFFVAFKLPNMFRRLTAEGALVQSFLPIFTFIEEQKSKDI